MEKYLPQRRRAQCLKYDDDDGEEILSLLNTLGQSELHLNFQRLSSKTNTYKDPYTAVEDAVHNLSGANTGGANADKKRSCASCSKKVRVENVSSLRKGQHISMPGHFAKKLGEYWHKMVHIYQHHAIIKEIKSQSGTGIEVELIHFTKEDKKVAIYQTTETFDLVYDELYIIEYIYPRYTTDEIVQRAESMLPINNDGQHKFGTYIPFTNNCEHFATWCVIGDGQSLQCETWRKRIVNCVHQLFGEKILKIVIKTLMTLSDEIASNFTLHPEYVFGGTFVIYLIYCIVMAKIHIEEFRKGHLCKNCLKGKLQKLYTKFALFGVTSIPSLIVLPLLCNPTGIPLIIMSVLQLVALQWSVPRIRKALQSPFDDDGKIIKQLSEIEIGDVVVLKYYKIEHAVIVTEVHEDDEVSTIGRIKGVHYGLSSFGIGEVMEEYFTINIRKSAVKVIDCSNLLTNTPDTTVMLARKRVGERKWALTSNRSDHLCHWAKFKQRPRSICENWDNGDLGTSSTKVLSSRYTRSTEVHLENDLHLGDVIEYEKTGVVVGKEVLDSGRGRRLKIEMIVYDWEWYFTKKTYTVDLNKDRIIIKHYHPAHCHPMAVRKDRANRLEGKKGTWWTNDGFIKHCIMLKSTAGDKKV